MRHTQSRETGLSGGLIAAGWASRAVIVLISRVFVAAFGTVVTVRAADAAGGLVRLRLMDLKGYDGGAFRVNGTEIDPILDTGSKYPLLLSEQCAERLKGTLQRMRSGPSRTGDEFGVHERTRGVKPPPSTAHSPAATSSAARRRGEWLRHSRPCERGWRSNGRVTVPGLGFASAASLSSPYVLNGNPTDT